MSDRLTTEIHMSDDAREGVVLLHGIRRTHRSMRKIARACQSAGFATLNIDYPSSKGTIEDHAMQIAPAIITFATRFERVHLVGFSMGALVIREFLAHYRPSNLGRVVFLGPPLGGSHIADMLTTHQHLSRIAPKWWGPALAELTTAHQQARPQPEVDYPLGIIAGATSLFGPWSKLLNNLPNDGLVALDNTRMEGMGGHIVLPLHHNALISDRSSVRAVISFLKRGVL